MKYSKNRFPGIQIISKRRFCLGLCAMAMLIFPTVSRSALLAGDEIYISFDNNNSNFTDGGDTWNRLGFTATLGVLDGNLHNTGNVPTGIGINLDNRMTGESAQGNTSGSVWPNAAADVYWFGDNGTHNGGSSGDNLGEFTITGLDQGLSYNFDIFASRGSVSGVRETDYTLTGANSGTATLDVVNNTLNSAFISNITPDGSGNITLRLQSGSNNDSGPNYFYINAMKITAIPEPSTFVLLLGALSMLVMMRRRK